MARRIGAACAQVKCVKCGKAFNIRVRGGDYGFVVVCAACLREGMHGRIVNHKEHREQKEGD